MNFISILFVVVVAANQLVVGGPVDQLQSLCANKQIELSRASELKHLVEALGSISDCPERVQSSIIELNKLINKDNENVCLPSKIEQTRAYYNKFIDKKSIESQHEQKIPKSVLNLFLSYGFRVNKICKSHLVSSLLSNSNELLTEQDFAQISKWTSNNSTLGKLLKTPKDVDDLVLPKEIGILFYEKTKKKGQQISRSDLEQMTFHVVIDPARGKILRRVQVVCDRRFRPIYQQLILPLVSMSRIGLSFRGSELEHHLDLMKNEDVHRWHRIVFLCESVSHLQVFEDLKGNLKVGDSAFVLRDDEVEELTGSQEIAVLSTGYEDVAEKLNYHIEGEHKLDDLIVDKQDKSLAKLVAKFDAHKSEMRRIRWKLVRQVVAFMKEAFRSGKLTVVKVQDKGEETKMNEQLIDTIDEHAGEASFESDDQDDLLHSELSASGAHSRVKRVAIAAIVVLAICGAFMAVIFALGMFFILGGIKIQIDDWLENRARRLQLGKRQSRLW